MGNKLPTERRDDIDRREQSAGAKLAELCDMVKAQTGEDPRGGGWSFVGNPIVVATTLKELPTITRELAPKMAVSDSSGRGDADVIFRWNGIPVRLRCNAKGEVLHALKNSAIPPSRQIDRRVAGELRVAAHRDYSKSVFA